MQEGGASVQTTQDGISRLSVQQNGVQANGNGAIVPVGDVQSVALPAPDLAGIKSVDTHTKSLGVIQPPPDLKNIVDKTANFVARNGAQFEAQIREKQQNNPRFNFLRPFDVYHAYFKHQVAKEIRESAGGQESTAVQQAEQQAALAKQAAPAPVVNSTLARPIVAPDPDLYSVRTPEGLTAEHVDIIKLTAQCVARNGASFLTGLGQREQGNSTFLFLKPTHSLHGYFRELIEAYSRTLMPHKDVMAKIKRDAQDRQAVYERCLNRLEWEKNKEAQDKAATDKATAERVAMQSIDWHDFVVVETIDFFDDEDDELPPPMTQKDIVLLNRANAFRDEHADEEEPEQVDATANDVEMDEEEQALVNEGNAAPPSQPPAALEPPQPARPQQAQVRVEAEDEEPMRIVKDYQRPVAKANAQGAAGMAVSPITGELVPLSEMAEHMRISLMDPQWRTQREAMLSKIRETTEASDDEISRNLVDLAGHRPDVFGSSEEEVGAIVKASMDEKRTTGNDRTPAWDGQTTGGASLHNQINAVNEHKADSLKRKEPSLPTPILGPRPPNMPSTLPPPPVQGSSSAAPQVRLPAGAASALPGPPQAAVPPILPPPARPPTLAPPPVLPPPQRMPPPSLPPAPAPAPAAPGPPPVPVEEPEAKRQRVESFVLQSESDFLQQIPGASKVRVVCPEDSEYSGLNGQVLEVEVASLSSTIGELKSRLAEVLSLPPNKQQLSREHFRNLKDVDSLAYYNISPNVEVNLAVRRRGGR